jgi:hypothetical protein
LLEHSLDVVEEEKVAGCEGWGRGWMQCGSQVVIVQKLLDPFCDVWLRFVSVQRQSSSISSTMKRTDFKKSMITITLDRSDHPLGRIFTKWNARGVPTRISAVFRLLIVWDLKVTSPHCAETKFIHAGSRSKTRLHRK